MVPRFMGSCERSFYMSKLYRERSSRTEPHVIVAVAGGGSFFHGIGAACSFLLVVDRDPSTVAFCSIVRKLIVAADSLTELLGMFAFRRVDDNLLACLTTEKLWNAPRWDPNVKLSEVLSQDELDSWNETWANPPPFWRYTNREKVCFFQPYEDGDTNSVNWYFTVQGSALENEQSFQALRYALSRAQAVFKTASVEELDFGCLTGRGSFQGLNDPVALPVVTYLSNSDTTAWTQGDAILRRVLSTLKTNVTYLSWTRTLELQPNHHHQDCMQKLTPFTRGCNVYEVQDWKGGPAFKTQELCTVKHQVYKSIDELVKQRHPKWLSGRLGTAVLFHLSWDPNAPIDGVREQAIWLFRSYLPARSWRIILLDRFGTRQPSDWLSWADEAELYKSFRVELIDRSGGADTLSRNFLIVWSARGACLEPSWDQLELAS